METEQPVLLNAAPAPLWMRTLAALRRPALLLTLLAMLLLGWQWLETRMYLADLQQELSSRMAQSDAVAKESRMLSRQNQEMLEALGARIALLEARQADAQSQQLTLENMYQELSRSRDERVLVEVEQAVVFAAQQLQLTGNVEAVLNALQGIDARLVRTGQPRLLPLRKLINRDIDRLKALPLADVPGITLKLEAVIGAVDNLPLAFEQRARVEPAVKTRSNSRTPVKPVAGNAVSNFWQDLGRELWAEMRQLIRVERIEHPAPALLAPSQVFFLRENLKLRLIDARLALLQRDGRAFREDLRQARELLERYFDTREKAVSNAVAMLKGLSAANLSLELPSLGETLDSIRNFKLPPDNPLFNPRNKSLSGGVSPVPAKAGAER